MQVYGDPLEYKYTIDFTLRETLLATSNPYKQIFIKHRGKFYCFQTITENKDDLPTTNVILCYAISYNC